MFFTNVFSCYRDRRRLCETRPSTAAVKLMPILPPHGLHLESSTSPQPLQRLHANMGGTKRRRSTNPLTNCSLGGPRHLMYPSNTSPARERAHGKETAHRIRNAVSANSASS